MTCVYLQCKDVQLGDLGGWEGFVKAAVIDSEFEHKEHRLWETNHRRDSCCGGRESSDQPG